MDLGDERLKNFVINETEKFNQRSSNDNFLIIEFSPKNEGKIQGAIDIDSPTEYQLDATFKQLRKYSENNFQYRLEVGYYSYSYGKRGVLVEVFGIETEDINNFKKALEFSQTKSVR